MLMLTYRRAVLTTGLVLVLFFLFFGGSSNLSPKSFFQNTDLEQSIRRVKEDSENILREFQRTAREQAELQDKKLEAFEQERKLLDKQLQQLRRLPSDTPVRTQLAYQFPYDVSSRFPAYIWQTWKQSLDDPKFDGKFRENVNSWRDKNSGFVHEVMSDDMAHAIIQHLYMNVPQVIEAFQAMPENILRADFFRYLILLARGGIYSDVDTQALKPVPNWIPENVDPQKLGLVIGIEADPDRPDWAEWYARRIQFCQWTIQSKPGHPVLRDIVAKITEETLHRKHHGTLPLPNSKDRGSQIMDWTGPGIWTDSIFEYFNDPLKSGLHYQVSWQNFTGIDTPVVLSDVLILPITSFSPGIGTMGAQSESHPLAYVKHHFEGSWKPANERMNG
ncbi:uncharacterized protein SAPINGB_P003836 [Magnusiomyces paraingens]|uniref:Glycosyltransferase family 32 protein n=1 Tax=Magnusiomyces paraingens TaxID=2606893 RepID=A0A5E8BTL6_9ASCO|nr:uncharacterized protein SAPINGB_P003836 [Saprochaete ingens]VVT53959.1 unnamed protein product [Saprochaete ingens]